MLIDKAGWHWYASIPTRLLPTAGHQQILAHIEDPYWHQVALLLAQLQGIADGYNDHAETEKRMMKRSRAASRLVTPFRVILRRCVRLHFHDHADWARAQRPVLAGL